MFEWHDRLEVDQFYSTLQHYINVQFQIKSEYENYCCEFYEYLCSINIGLEELDLKLENMVSTKERKKKTASYYTPHDIFKLFQIELSNQEYSVLEPACGAGQLVLDLISTCDTSVALNIDCYDISIDAILCTKFRVLLNFHNMINLNINYHCVNFLEVHIEQRFDIVLSNPPYYEIRKQDYAVQEYKYAKGNIYSLFLEKAINLLNEDGNLYFIVPYSLVSTLRMSSMKEYIEHSFSTVRYINFADRPSSLFPSAHQRITLLSAESYRVGEEKKIMNTEYIHFYKSEREKKLNNIRFYENSNSTFRISNDIEKSIIAKVTMRDQFKYISGDFHIYMNLRAGFWMKALKHSKSNSYKKFSFENAEKQAYFYCFINSSLFYFLWLLSGDGWHVVKADLNKIYINNQHSTSEFISLMNVLDCDLEKKKKYIGSKQVDYIYQHKESKGIIDKIDLILGKSFDLSPSEIDYIQNFNIKYRLGGNNEST